MVVRFNVKKKRGEAERMKLISKCLSLLLTAVLATVACALPAAAASAAEVDLPTLLSTADSFAKVGKDLYFTVAQSLYRWETDESASLIAQGVGGQLVGDTDALYALDFSRRTLTLLTLSQAGPVVPAEVYLLDSPALLDAAGAPRLLRGYAASDGWLFLLVESDLPLKTDLLTLRLADGRWQTMERQNIQAIAACGNGTVLMASYDIRDEMSGCEIFRYNAESGETAVFATLTSLRPESLAFVPEENLVCLEMDGTVYLCKEHDTAPLPIARLGETAPVSYACLVDGRYLSLRAAGGITAITADLEGIEPVVLTFAGCNSISSQDNPAFMQAYPHVTVRFRNDPPGTDYAVELITGAHTVDVYLFQAASPQYHAVISKGYALDLSQNEILTEAAASYAPFLAEALYSPDGALAAIPMDDLNAPVLYEAYLNAWQAANLGPLPTTVKELLDACIAFSQREDLLSDGWRFFLSDVDDAAAFKREMLQLILQTYLAEFTRDDGSVEIDTPEFRALLTKYEEALPAMERIAAETSPLPSSGFYLEQVAQTCLLSYPGATLLPQDGPRIATAFLPLTVSPGASPVVEADVTVFVINPASPNRDLALAYLETYVQNLSPHKRIQYVSSEVSPIEQESYRQDKALLLEEKASICSDLTRASPDESSALQTRLKAVRLDLANLEAHRYSTTGEMIERYKELTPYLRIHARRGLNFFTAVSQEMVGLLNQYVQGAIDVEHFINRYATMARMMMLESALN